VEPRDALAAASSDLERSERARTSVEDQHLERGAVVGTARSRRASHETHTAILVDVDRSTCTTIGRREATCYARGALDRERACPTERQIEPGDRRRVVGRHGGEPGR